MQDYEIIRKIGKGSFGNVLLVREKNSNKLFALKKIIPSSEKPSIDSVNPLTEVDVLRSLDHFNIIKYYKCFGHKDKLCILMEYADDGDLSMRVAKAQQTQSLISEKQIVNWLSQLCLALKHIHEKNIIHRDIKVQNVLLMKNGLIKLGDFGISKILKNQNDFAKTSVGTPYYYSPELCNAASYSYKTDIWMLGCLLYELCTLEKPFPGNSYPEIIQKITHQEPNPISNNYSPFIKNLIVQLLTKDQFTRPNIDDVMATKEIKAEIDRIKQMFEESKPKSAPPENYLDVKKKTLSKPVSFGNLPTYSTEYNEINSKKTMTPHFIPQEMLKDFEKNSILNLIQQISNSKKGASPNKLPDKSIFKEGHSHAKDKQMTIIIPHTQNNSSQMSFETYLQQKIHEGKEESNKPNIYSSFRDSSTKADPSTEITRNENETQPFDFLNYENDKIDETQKKEENNDNIVNLDQLDDIHVINRADSNIYQPIKSNNNIPANNENINDKDQKNDPSSKSPLKRYHPKTPESNFSHPRLKDLITSHMTFSLNKQSNNNNVNNNSNNGNNNVNNTNNDTNSNLSNFGANHHNNSNTNAAKKKVGFEINPDKDFRGRVQYKQMTDKRFSPKSASLNKRKTYHIDWGDWFMEKVKTSHDMNNNNPRSIILKEFLKFKREKENISKSPFPRGEEDAKT